MSAATALRIASAAAMRNTWSCAALAAALSVCCVGCDIVPTIEAHAAYARFTTEGDVGLETSSGRIDRVDTASLGLDDAADLPYLQARLQTFAGNLNASAFRLEQSGRGQLGADTGFGGIGGGGVPTAVQSDLEISNLKAFYSFDIVDLEVFRIGPGVGVDIFDIETTVASTDVPVGGFERIDVLAPVPMLFVDASASLFGLRADVEAGWMSASLEDASGTWFDIEARLLYEVVDHIDLMAGYRYISIDADGDADGQAFDAELAVHGWYVGGGVRW